MLTAVLVAVVIVVVMVIVVDAIICAVPLRLRVTRGFREHGTLYSKLK